MAENNFRGNSYNRGGLDGKRCPLVFLPEEFVDEDGVRWRAVYTGNGTHFENWAEQIIEVFGRENIKIKRTTPAPPCTDGTPYYTVWKKVTEYEGG